MFYVYILKSLNTDKYYVGSTSNITQRLKRHNSGRNKSTKPGIPWIIVYEEVYTNRNAAYQREFQIKKFKGGTAFKKLLLKKIQ